MLKLLQENIDLDVVEVDIDSFQNQASLYTRSYWK